MDGDVPTTQTMKAAYAQGHWGEVIEKVHRGRTRVLVQHDGIPVAAIVSADDLRRLNKLDQEQSDKAIVATSSAHAIDPEVLLAPPSAEELARRKAVVAEVLANRKQRVITPLTSADLVHRARAQEQRSYGKPR